MHDASSKIAPEPEFQGSAAISLQTAADAVYAALRERIIAGQLTPGSRLTEASLCARFGLSTTPVREALQRLVHRGLGIRYTARGVSVRRLTSAEIRDIYELRCLLEPLALQQSVPNLTARHLAGIREVLSTAQSALARMDYLRLSGLNDTFHTEILAGSRNRRLLDWIGELSDQRRLIALVEWATDDRAARELDEHFMIFARTEAGDANGAAELLLKHISDSSQSLLQHAAFADHA